VARLGDVLVYRGIVEQPCRQARGDEPRDAYRGLALVGAFLLFGRSARPSSDVVFWQLDVAAEWFTVVISALGLMFASWARVHLGRLWSGQVTRKENHHIVTTGPYALMRHPIYGGVIVAALATAALRGTLSGLLGASFIAAALYIKARLEEHFLREELGMEGYAAYVRRVPMFMPFSRGRSSG
jgi:protein-S-isoprenylcysteine O-methyltransferase Ste14